MMPSLTQGLPKLAAVATVALLLNACSIAPPTEQMAMSKMAVRNATSAGGTEYAPVALRSAMEKMDAAERAMTAQEYTQARHLAEQAQVDAQLAASTARTAKAQKAATALQEDNRVLRKEIDRNAQ
ncbi:MAG: DUF4398 domain-containing protein [Methylococcaceae bacterium]|nr:DUF4398 domain-containing protein [Methylococcaceae bacterium]